MNTMAKAREPLLVGIDVGMTCTGETTDLNAGSYWAEICFVGVAYIIKSPAIEMVEPRTIQKWPGNGTVKADKVTSKYVEQNVFSLISKQVPTSLCYHGGRQISWGFQTQQDDTDELEVHDWFKIFLDEREYDKFRSRGEEVPPSHGHVKRYYADFLKKLYAHVKKILSAELPSLSFEDETIEFIFSVPTTWSPGVAEDLRALAREAGFGRDGANHSVQIGLTESEAAAVCTLGTESERYSVSIVMSA